MALPKRQLLASCVHLLNWFDLSLAVALAELKTVSDKSNLHEWTSHPELHGAYKTDTCRVKVFGHMKYRQVATLDKAVMVTLQTQGFM